MEMGGVLLYLLYVGFPAGMCVVWSRMLPYLDPDHGLRYERKPALRLLLFLLAFGIAAWREHDITQGMMLCFLASYLGTASYCDHQTKSVYRIQQYPAALAGAVYLMCGGPTRYQLISLGLYLCVQAIALRKCYGRADVRAFMIVSLFLADSSISHSILLCGLLHVGASLFLLLLFRSRDMDWKRGRLKEPAAFLPYVSAAALFLVLMKGP